MTPRMKKLLEEYGAVAIVTYFAIFFVVVAGFAIALRSGASAHVEGLVLRLGAAPDGDVVAGVRKAATVGGGWVAALGGGWLAAKITQPLRILATVALTPLLAALWRRLRPPARAATPTGEALERTGEKRP